MPILRRATRAAILLATACAVVCGATASLAQIAGRGAGMIYYFIDSPARAGRHTFIFDPRHQIHHNLSVHQGIAITPRISPDGQKIAFLYHAAGISELRLFDFGTDTVTTLFSKGEPQPSYLTIDLYGWSPSGRYLNFSSSGRLFKFDFAIGAASPLIQEDDADRFNDTYPTWSPDETRVAFASSQRETSSWQIYMANADGSDLRRVTRLSACVFYAPRWSPASGSLLLEGGCDSSSTVYVFDADTGSLRPLTDFPFRVWGATWSPDGSRILFVSGRDVQEQRIYTIGADGSGLRRLTNGNVAFWSPDSRTILFSSLMGDLYTIDADGDSLPQLALSGGNPFMFPFAWSR